MKNKKFKKKLFSMRYTKKQMSQMDRDETFEAYGRGECINELLIWINSIK